jgi:hypothetical protein
MIPAMNDTSTVQTFIDRWQGVTASELATAQSFVMDLCDLLGVERPHATDDQAYMFERPVVFQHGDGGTSAGRIDCYRRGAFVLETKKLKVSSLGVKASTNTKGFDDANDARTGYARARRHRLAELDPSTRSMLRGDQAQRRALLRRC